MFLQNYPTLKVPVAGNDLVLYYCLHKKKLLKFDAMKIHN